MLTAVKQDLTHRFYYTSSFNFTFLMFIDGVLHAFIAVLLTETIVQFKKDQEEREKEKVKQMKVDWYLIELGW